MSRAIDVLHLGLPEVICCHEIDGYIVDPGPESALGTLLEALGDQPPRAVLLTHIHFDHAGAAGAIVRRWPDVEVYVHEAGARHMADPERLVSSARRIFGAEFDRLWGEVVPIPERNLRVLSGGETIDGFRVAYTPGHAIHHVSYLHEASRTAYVGDVAGVRIAGGPIVPPTPPPDIDLEAWHASVDLVQRWAPQRLALTHFGVVEADVEAHLAVMHEALHMWGELARNTDQDGFAAAVRRRVDGLPSSEAFYRASPPEMLWPGLNRYWSERLGVS